MKPCLSGKWAVVTGGSSGIGLEFARRLAAMGARLLLVSNQPDELAGARAALGRDYGAEVATLPLDLATPRAPAILLREMDSLGVDPYIFINNAGIFAFRELTAMDPARIDLFISLHVGAVTHLSRLIALRMAENGAGYILNMSSMSCWTPMPGISMYAATKAYIRVFTRSLHYEMRDRGVRVMAACPGGIATDLFGLPERLKRLAVRIGALYTPRRFVRLALRRLLKGRMQYVNGPLNRLGILAVGITPTPIRMMVKHRMLDKGITR